MSFVNKISNILKHDRNNISESENVQQILLLNFTIILIAVLNLIFSITHFLFFEKSVSYILFSYFVVFTSLFYIFKRNKNYKLCSNIAILLITSLFLLLIIAGSGQKTGIIWGLTYPILVSLTFTLKKANYYSLIFLALTLFLFIVPSELWAEYTTDLKIRYAGAYIGIYLFLQYYLRLKQQAVNNREKQILDIKQKLREKDEFLSKLSYQIRTPLNNIAGIFNVKRDILGEETVEEVELSVSNLITIVNSIPELSEKKLLQIEGGKTLFSFNSSIKKSVNLFQTDKYQNLKCSINLSNKIPQLIYGDRFLLTQVIISAIDFLYNNTKNEFLKIDLSTYVKEDDNNSYLEIKANSDYKLLKPHLNKGASVNVDETKINELLMIKELVILLSGKYEIFYNTSNTTFLFNFNFPPKQIESKKPSTDEYKVKARVDFFNNNEKKDLKDVTVLLVEDDVMNSKVMTLNLNKHVNKIIIAVNGKDALEKYASTKVDIILMDIRMPLMDGFKTTEKIREAELGIGYQIPIIAVTANASSEIKQKCFDVGMNDYTTKPTNFKLLIKKMKAQLSK